MIGTVHDESSMVVLNKLVEVAGSADGVPVCDVLVVDCGVVDEENLDTAVAEERSRRVLAPVGGLENEVDAPSIPRDE